LGFRLGVTVGFGVFVGVAVGLGVRVGVGEIITQSQQFDLILLFMFIFMV
jgi:hypothetical protein